MNRLTERVAIVTGASRGIGRHTAFELARRGVRVAIAARTVEARRRLPGTIGETLAAIEQAGGKAIAVQTDVTQPADLQRLVTTVAERFGRLDILVNNAAETNGDSTPIEAHTRESWLRQFEANVHAPFTLMGLAVPHMKTQGGGVIVNITSGAGDMVDRDLSKARESAPPPGPHPSADDVAERALGYATTKAALNRLTNAVAPQLAQHNIAVAAVEPGFTRTEFVDVLAERGVLDAATAHSMDLPVAKVLEIITAENPLAYAGKILRVYPQGTLR